MSTHQTAPKHAIILAAGFGSRLDPDEGHKILVEVGGRTLLDAHLSNFAKVGVEHLTVVTGYRSEALAAQLEAHSHRSGLAVHTAFNPDFESSNGLSVLAGVDAAGEALGDAVAVPFWLTMSDHLFDPALFERLGRDFLPADPAECQGMLAVDRKLDTIFDMPDANKVQTRDGELVAIGKQLADFDLVDVGLFWCHEGFVDALRAELAERGDCNTSDAVRRLSAAGQFCFWDVGPHLWQDVDTPGARAHAEELVVEWSS